MLNRGAPGVNARSVAEVVREHFDAVEIPNGWIEERRRTEVRRRLYAAIPVQRAVDAVGNHRDRIREADAASATGAAQCLVVNAVSKAQNGLVEHAIG